MVHVKMVPLAAPAPAEMHASLPASRLKRHVRASVPTSRHLEGSDLGQHVVDARGGRVVVAGRVGLGGGDLEVLDDAVHDVHGEALAAVGAQHAHRPRVVQHQPKRLGALAARVGEEGDVGARNLHGFRPRTHDGTVVHAEHQHLVNPGSLKSVLALEETRDLARRSGGCECAGQTDHEGLLARQASGHLHLGGGEAEVQGHGGERITDGDHLARFASYGGRGGEG
mmetsp:Transcript_31013/g.49865  ORF Transcript_31013/g.49865 Transcript_31013/m.49865 type:complete len:226 (+) Transcript_31013:301-978(+)